MKMRVMKSSGHACQICGSKIDLTIDHIIPLSLGGTNRENNLTVLCRPCNQKKAANIYPEFIRT